METEQGEISPFLGAGQREAMSREEFQGSSQHSAQGWVVGLCPLAQKSPTQGNERHFFLYLQLCFAQGWSITFF